MIDIAPVFPLLPAVSGKKVSAAFDGGRITSDGGVLLLASTRARRICARLAALVPDGRDPTRTRHSVADIFLARSLAIAAGYEDADDLDDLRHDPAFKMALGKAPDAQIGLVSQPTMSRWENNADLRCAIRMANAMIDVFCESYDAPPTSITLDIDETFDAAHGQQQLSFWNGFYGERGFLPIHVYDTATGRPLACVLRTAKTPSGQELRAQLRRLIRRIRRYWPWTRIVLRGDGHYSRPEVMAWCEARENLDYIFGLPSNSALRKDPIVAGARDVCAVRRAKEQLPVLRGFCETRYAAASWVGVQRRVIARISAANIGPNRFHQNRIFSWPNSIPHSCRRSSTLRNENGKRTYIMTAMRMISGLLWKPLKGSVFFFVSKGFETTLSASTQILLARPRRGF